MKNDDQISIGKKNVAQQAPASPMRLIKEFHTHLDECRQCRENPFGLCAKGHELLMKTEGNRP